MKPFVRIVLLTCIVAFCAATVYPCSCEVWKPEKKLRKARAVFVGEVVAIGSNDKDSFATVSIKFKVYRYWKGIKEPYISVVSAPGICCTCGLAVSVGLKYLIYAFKTENDQIETSLCMSAPLDADRSQDELRVLGKGKIPKTRPATNAVEQIVGRERREREPKAKGKR